MNKPRICYVNPPVLLKRPVSEIIDRLSKKGYATSLLVPKRLFRKRDASLHHSKLVEKSRVYAYSIINPPFLSSEQPIPITPIFCINTYKAMKSNDIIHMWVPYYLTSFKIILTKKIFFPSKKLILTMDTIPSYSFSMGKFWDALFKIYNKLFGWLLFGTPDTITLYGKSLFPHAIKAGVSKNKIKVISTGIDSRRYSQKEKQKNSSYIREKLDIKQDTPIVLYAGLIIPRKGIDKIIRVADKLRNEDLVFLLAGDGPKRKQYEREVEELGLDSKVLFLGWRTDMHKIYQATDLVLLPAEGEGLPGLVMEAMSYGIPCIASNIPCIPDLIDNGRSGFLCNKDDVNEFAARVNELAKDKTRRDKLGKEAQHKIKEFEWKRIIPLYESLYRK